MTKKPLLFIILIGLSIVSTVQAQLLWRISGKGLDRPSYLFGTHHLIPTSFLDSVPGLFHAFAQCDVVVGELVMNHIDTNDKIARASMLPQGMTMDSLLCETERELVDRELQATFKLGLKELGLMKPSVICTMYEMELYRRAGKMAEDDIQSDSYFQFVAEQKGMQVLGLESVDKQIALLFDSRDLKRDARLLVETMRRKEECLDDIRTLDRLYKAGRVDSLVVLAREPGDPTAMTAEEYDRMVDRRNLDWMGVLPDYLHAHACFIAVGAMHLGGENGLIQLLKKEGYKVKAINK